MSELLKINVKDLLEYDPTTGLFTWDAKRGCRAKGQPAGSRKPNGYISIFLCGRRYYAHRLAFFAMTGQEPAGVVDHINGDKSDNRWANLRAVSQSVNMENRIGAQSNSKTGLIGASPHACGRYIAQIRRNGMHKYLGLFDTAEAAHAAYIKESANV